MKLSNLVFVLVAMLLGISGLRGEEMPLQADVSIPEGKENFSCVVICPGRGYHKDLPLVKDLAERLVEEGFGVVRFNWTFYTAKGKPSEDGAKEIADIENAIALAKNMPGIDSSRIYIAGKSLGSLYGYHAFQQHPELKACILITPIIPEKGAGADYYPNLKEENRRVVCVLGDVDTDNCPLQNLYDYICETGKNIPVVTLSGAHSFEENSDYTDPVNIHNTKMAIEMIVYWLKKV